MPFIQRIVDPTHVSRVEVDRSVTNELECVTNHSLANIIRQLSSLSQHAEDMFADLYRETVTFFNRSSELNNRVEHLRMKVTQLNPTEEEVSLQDIHLRKPYQSSRQHDQQVVSRITIPKAIQDVYNRCEKPPCLDKLNQYREDGKDCMKFYTDPSYFFELWFSEMRKDIENRKKEVKAKRVKKNRSPSGQKPVKPKQVKSKAEKYKDFGKGLEFRSDYQIPVTQPGGGENIQVPPGMTRQNSAGNRPGQLHVQQAPNQTHESMGQPNAVPNNMHNNIDKQTMNGPYSVHQQYTQDQYDQNYDMQQRANSRRAHEQGVSSPHGVRSSTKSVNMGSPSHRPVAPPPPPPADMYSMQKSSDRGSISPQRQSLPPPPPPPPLDNGYPDASTPGRNPPLQNIGYQGSIGGTPRHMSPGRDQDLPPPPPPPMMSPNTPDMPLPPSPPPVLNHNVPTPPMPFHQSSAPVPPPPPPPPPNAPPPPVLNGQPDTISVSSENSTYSSTASARDVPPEPPKMTERNALLDEIRLGDWNKKLRKTAEKQETKAPTDRFDVHAIMNKAFDMRRKAIEDSESENEDDDDDWESE